MEDNEELLPAVSYYRKSKGDDFATQVMRCKQYADRVGRKIVHEYADEDISGAKRLHRKGFEQLLEDMRSGKLAGHIVIVRDQDRLTRDDRLEIDQWFIVSGKSGVPAFDATGREIKDDITTGVLALVAREEAKMASARIKARWEERAIAGKAPSHNNHRPPFGYTAGYKEQIPEQIELLREARDKLFAGVKIWTIVESWRKRGIKTNFDNDFTTGVLSLMLKRPEYAGWKKFKRDIEVEGKVISKGQPVAKGDWYDRRAWDIEDWEKLVEILGKNKRFSESTARKHLLAGILVCTFCGSKLQGKPARRDYYVYTCVAPGCRKVSRKKESVDKYILGLTYGAIKKLPEVGGKEPKDDTPEKIANLRKKLAETVQAYKDDQIGLTELVEIRRDTEAKIAQVKKQQKKKRPPLPVDTAEKFLKASTAEQRDTIRRLWPVIGLGSATGTPRRFHPSQLVFPEGE